MSKYRIASLTVAWFVTVAFAPGAKARSQRVNQVPNNEWNCQLCHQSPAGGWARTAFGEQVEKHLSTPKASAKVDWQAIYDLDADGDGFTNGEELADPEGKWSMGGDDPEGEVTDPNDPDDTPSGGEADAGGESDAGSMTDAGSSGSGSGDSGSGCSVAGGRPARGLWLAVVVGILAVSRRE